MKKSKVLIFIFILIFIIPFLILAFLKMEKLTISDFIDDYNSLLQKNVDKSISIRSPKNSDRLGATYFIPITDEIYLGIANDSLEAKIDLSEDNLSASLLQYDKNITDYTEINKYLFYLIKTNNKKIPDSKITDLIYQLRKNPSLTIKKYNLIIKHSSSDCQIDSIGRVEY